MNPECTCEGEFIWACGDECACWHHLMWKAAANAIGRADSDFVMALTEEDEDAEELVEQHNASVLRAWTTR